MSDSLPTTITTSAGIITDIKYNDRGEICQACYVGWDQIQFPKIMPYRGEFESPIIPNVEKDVNKK